MSRSFSLGGFLPPTFKKNLHILKNKQTKKQRLACVPPSPHMAVNTSHGTERPAGLRHVPQGVRSAPQGWTRRPFRSLPHHVTEDVLETPLAPVLSQRGNSWPVASSPGRPWPHVNPRSGQTWRPALEFGALPTRRSARLLPGFYGDPETVSKSRPPAVIRVAQELGLGALWLPGPSPPPGAGARLLAKSSLPRRAPRCTVGPPSVAVRRF